MRSDNCRDEDLVAELRRVHAGNFSVYGARKMQVAMRADWILDRDRTAGLMKATGPRWVNVANRYTPRPPTRARTSRPNRVERRFADERPRQLWVVDLTYIRTWAGFAHTAFVTDVFSRKVGLLHE